MKKRVVFLSENYYEQNIGGAEYQLFLILDDALRRGFEVHYISISDGKKFKKSLDVNLHLIPKKKLSRSFGKNYFLYTLRILKLLNIIRPDIIYQRVASALTGIAAIYAGKSCSKLIWHISHDNDLALSEKFDTIETLPERLDRIFLNYGIRNANVILAQTNYQCDLLDKYFARKCDAIIVNGHPCPEDIKGKPNGIQILWVANFKPWKRPEIFLRLARSISSIPNVTCLMVGRPGSSKMYESLFKKIDQLHNLHYLGEVSFEKVNELLDVSHLLVNTSKYEGFSNTFVQAWMRCVPVVSLSVDPDGILCRERIGFLSGTFDQLVDDVTFLIHNRAMREEMGRRARLYALENHSSAKMLQEVFGFFQ